MPILSNRYLLVYVKFYIVKVFFLILFVLYIQNCFSQTYISGILKDKNSDHPIYLATINSLQSNSGTVSNKEGAFRLNITSNNDSICISHIAYYDLIIPVSSCNDSSSNYYLKPRNILLAETKVTTTPVNEILQQAIETSAVKMNYPILLETYYREFVKINGKNKKFSDGTIGYNIKKSSKNKIKCDAFVHESRAIDMSLEEDVLRNINSLLDVRKAARYYNIPRLTQFLNKKEEIDKYSFSISEHNTNPEYFCILVQPKAEVEEFLSERRYTIEKTTNLIREYEVRLPESHVKYEKTINAVILKVKLTDIKVKSVYSNVAGKYTLAYSSEDFSLYTWNKNILNDTIRFVSDLVVTYVNAQPNLAELNKGKKYKHKALYKRGNSYKTEFWKTNSSLVMTHEEEEAVKKLQNSIK